MLLFQATSSGINTYLSKYTGGRYYIGTMQAAENARYKPNVTVGYAGKSTYPCCHGTHWFDATLFVICVVSHQYSWSLPVTSCITTFEAIHNVAVVVK